MSRAYSPITILDPTTYIQNTQHWPHVQSIQSYHYIRSYHLHTEHTALTTYPVRSVQSLYFNIPPTYVTNSTDNMSSIYTPIAILDANTHTWNTLFWPHVRYVQSYRYIRSHHLHMRQTTLTTCPVRTVQSLSYIPTPKYQNINWPHIQSVQSYHYDKSHHPYVEPIPLTTCPVRTFLMMIGILDPTTHIWNTQHWPHVQCAQSYC